jgi:hypothetical protein
LQDIVGINTKKFFTLQEAEELLPLIFRVTEESSKQAKLLMKCIEALPQKNSDRSKELEAQLDAVIERWQKKISRLGAFPKGLWLADFDFGSGYWCWKFPETKIQYYHGYKDGFSGRKIIDRGILEIKNESGPGADQLNTR